MNFTGESIISANQFSSEDIATIFEKADFFQQQVHQKGCLDILSDKVMATLFYEPSTRTRLSFESAMQRLGGRVVSTSSARHYSSVTKGESLKDTIRTIQQYVDIIVMRHTDKGAAKEAVTVTDIPLINAGDGTGEHPSQALLDLYTIKKETGKNEGLHIAMVGDLKFGRTIHSLTKLLSLFDNKITFIAPDVLQVPDWVTSSLDISFSQQTELEPTLPEADVLYITRIQKERFESEEEYAKYKGIYKITPETMNKAKPSAALMHPLPRVDEIVPEVDSDPRAAYFKQVKNGMFIRMALLALVMGK